jgi:hypothetical protein
MLVIDMRVYLFCAILLSMLCINLTDMGIDKERLALDKIRNSQGILVKLRVEE